MKYVFARRRLVDTHSWALLALAASTPGFAADAVADAQSAAAEDSGLLAEIVVSAQKKEEGLQKVPMAVQVVSGRTLEAQGTPDLERLSTSLPAVIVRRSANSQRIVIRGVGSGTNRGFEQSVGTFTDGIYYGQGQQIRPKLLDVARVEVLKGPQSTLFGANVTAGAFNIVTNDPTPELEGSGTLLVGSRDELEATGVISGPLTEDLGYRAAFYRRKYDGDLYNVSRGRNVPGEDHWGGRAVLAFKPSDRFTVRASWEHQKLELTGNPVELYYDPSVATAVTATVGLPGVLDYRETGGVLTSFQAVPNGFAYDALDLDTGILKAVYGVGRFNLTSVTGYTRFSWENVTDFSYAPPQTLAAFVKQHFRQFSQEVRIDGPVTNWLDLIAGAYYHDQKLDSFVITESVPLGGYTTSPALQDTEYGALFSQATAHVRENLRFTGGLRYDDLKKDVHDVLTYSKTGIAIFGANAHDLTATRDENHLSWLGRTEYDVATGVLVYASASRGFKSGGFDINGSGTSRGNVPSASFRFEPEKATSYEAGLKARLFDNNAALNVSFYHLIYSNLQVSQFIGAGFAVGNANAKTDGFDVDYRHALASRLTVGAVVAYNDFEFTSYAGAPCTLRQNAGLDTGCNTVTRTQDLTGKPGELAPKVSGSVSVEWRPALSDRMDLLFNLSPTFSSSYYTQIGADPNARQSGYTMLNARIGLLAQDDRWELQLIGRNLTDKAVAANSFNHATFPLTYGKVPTQRRGVAAELRYNF